LKVRLRVREREVIASRLQEQAKQRGRRRRWVASARCSACG